MSFLIFCHGGLLRFIVILFDCKYTSNQVVKLDYVAFSSSLVPYVNQIRRCFLFFLYMQTRQYQPCTGNGDTAVEEFNPETSLRSFVQESHNDCDKHSDTSDTVYHISDGHIGNSQNHTGSKFLPDYLKVAPHELRTQDRETAISRYKEKKKTRRYILLLAHNSQKQSAVLLKIMCKKVNLFVA